MIWLALAFGYGGLATLALAMVPHHRTVFGRVPGLRTRLCLRGAGATLLLLSLLVAARESGWPVGLVAWVSGLGIGGFVLTQLLTFAPRWLLAPVVVAGLALVAAPLLPGCSQLSTKSDDVPPSAAVPQKTISQ